MIVWNIEQSGTDTFSATYEVDHDEKWKQIGPWHQLYFKMDHFTGCRVGLFAYATKETGGIAEFGRFRYF